MRAMRALRHLLPALLGLSALASSAQTPPESDSQRLARELRELIGPARCTADNQCRTVAVGAKACGGPAAYWAWSTDGTDAKRVAALAAQHAAAQQREIAGRGLMSNCALVTEPAVACVAHKCQTLAQPAGEAR